MTGPTVGDVVKAWLSGNFTTEGFGTPTAPFVALWEFVCDIDWSSERWLQSLVAFHVMALVLVVAMRRSMGAQVSAFITTMVAALFAKPLNGWCARNWEAFSTRQYFDASGAFASLVYTGPLLIVSMLCIVNMIVWTAKTMVVVKRKQAIAKAKAKAKEPKSS